MNYKILATFLLHSYVNVFVVVTLERYEKCDTSYIYGYNTANSYINVNRLPLSINKYLQF